MYRTTQYSTKYKENNVPTKTGTNASRVTNKNHGGFGKRAALGDRTNTTTTRGAFEARKAPVTTAKYVEPVIETIAPSIQPFASHEEITHEDIDFDDVMDPQSCTEYVDDIMQHFRDKEVEYLADHNFMSRQSDINEKMRSILMDWLVEVHLKFKLLQETLYLTVNTIDRYLAIKPVARNKLQLVGITAMLIASKYEEIYAPEVRDFEYICDKAYTRAEILKMECHILNTLEFKLLAPYPLHFLRRFSKASRADLRTHTLAKYLIELTLVDYECVSFLPSTIAATSLCVALKMTGRGEWNQTLEHYSQYTEEALMPCVEKIVSLHEGQSSSSLQAVFKKYSSGKFLEVAKTTAPAL